MSKHNNTTPQFIGANDAATVTTGPHRDYDSSNTANSTETVNLPAQFQTGGKTVEKRRPGVSSEMLVEAGVRDVEADEARALVGYGKRGLVIPYRTIAGEPLSFDGNPFFRLRLSDPTAKAKYLSPRGAGCQLYIPPLLRALLLPGCVLGIVEGEFKAMALVEAGFPCVGIGGISSACPKNDAGEPELLPALAALIVEVRPSRIAFIGDSDTALIADFSREAVKLAKLSSVPVVLPRIALDAPGKGPDDLREILAANFPAHWRTILDAAESVTSATKPSLLVVRLLRREVKALTCFDGDALDKARERLVKLGAAVHADPIAAAEVEQIAATALRMTKAVFRAAVKGRAVESKREAAEDADHQDPLYFDGTNYWRREADGAFGRLCREDARLHFNKAGLSKSGDPSPCDSALHALQSRNRVDYAGPLCGRPAGLHHENGLRVLATRGSTWIDGKPGDSPTISTLIGNLCGHAAGDENAAKQCALFISWLKLARQALRNPTDHRPGQVFAIVGPPDSGKSLLQSEIITPALGGRCADPGLFFTGKTDFNADLWGAEHLAIGDKALDVEGAQRSTLRNELKRAVAEANYPLHGKCRDGLTFRPVWRITLSANSDPESASNLPAIDGSFADKIIYLLAYAPPVPFYDAEVPGAREAFAAKLREELPAFLASVDAFTIPAELRKARFGVTEWHHPEILDLLKEGDPLRPIAEILDRWIEGWPAEESERECPTVELYQALDDANENTLSRLRISTGPKHLGHQLAKLSDTDEWRRRLSRTTRRLGGRSANRPQACWLVKRNPAK
ncbi:MAG: DUF3854 domain-containing protein [Pedosphaera sp.]|nr:DUF3854 domain-containing protein [Pedosphaera sp.]